jgi:hypothetical protein
MMCLVFHSAKYKTEELESFHTIDEAFIVLAPYMNNPFLPFYSTRKRHHLQTQQKKSRTIIKAPTFKKCFGCDYRNERKDFCNSLRVSVFNNLCLLYPRF